MLELYIKTTNIDTFKRLSSVDKSLLEKMCYNLIDFIRK